MKPEMLAHLRISTLRAVGRIEIGIFVENFAVLIQQVDTDLRPNETLFYFLLNYLFHTPLKVIWKVLNESQDLLNRSALDHFFNEVVVGLIVIRVDVDFSHSAKQIVNVT